MQIKPQENSNWGTISRFIGAQGACLSLQGSELSNGCFCKFYYYEFNGRTTNKVHFSTFSPYTCDQIKTYYLTMVGIDCFIVVIGLLFYVLTKPKRIKAYFTSKNLMVIVA